MGIGQDKLEVKCYHGTMIYGPFDTFLVLANIISSL